MSMSNFKIIKFLGKGSYGSVHKVIRLEDDKEYAIKEINIRDMNQREREEAANEIRILASIRHPFVVRYFEAFFEDNKLFIVTEYAPGGDLYSKIKKQKQKNRYFEEEKIWSYLVQLLLGIRGLHNKNILHRDLKSPNIFLCDEDQLKIGDLGVSRVLKSDKALARTQVGTPYYVSPEIWRNKPYDAKCDIWSLGCLLYEIAALRRPFEADNLKNLVNKVYQNKFDKIPSFYSRELHDIIYSMLVTEPSKRPTVNELLDSPAIQKRMHLLPDCVELNESENIFSAVEEANQNLRLRSTIKVPRNLKNFTAHLPSPAYSGQKSSRTVASATRIVRGYERVRRQSSSSASTSQKDADAVISLQDGQRPRISRQKEVDGLPLLSLADKENRRPPRAPRPPSAAVKDLSARGGPSRPVMHPSAPHQRIESAGPPAPRPGSRSRKFGVSPRGNAALKIQVKPPAIGQSNRYRVGVGAYPGLGRPSQPRIPLGRR